MATVGATLTDFATVSKASMALPVMCTAARVHAIQMAYVLRMASATVTMAILAHHARLSAETHRHAVATGAAMRSEHVYATMGLKVSTAVAAVKTATVRRANFTVTV